MSRALAVVIALLLAACEGEKPRTSRPDSRPGSSLSAQESASEMDALRIYLVEGLSRIYTSALETVQQAAAESLLLQRRRHLHGLAGRGFNPQ